MSAQRTWSLVGAGIAAGAAGFELFRLIFAGNLTNLEMGLTVVASVTFIAVLAGTAVGMTLHRRFGFTFGVFGMLALLGYGFLIQAAANHDGRVHDPLGIAYVVLGLGLFACLVKSLPYYREPLVAKPA